MSNTYLKNQPLPVPAWDKQNNAQVFPGKHFATLFANPLNQLAVAISTDKVGEHSDIGSGQQESGLTTPRLVMPSANSHSMYKLIFKLLKSETKFGKALTEFLAAVKDLANNPENLKLFLQDLARRLLQLKINNKTDADVLRAQIKDAYEATLSPEARNIPSLSTKPPTLTR